MDTCTAWVTQLVLYKSPCPTKNEPPPQQQWIFISRYLNRSREIKIKKESVKERKIKRVRDKERKMKKERDKENESERERETERDRERQRETERQRVGQCRVV